MRKTYESTSYIPVPLHKKIKFSIKDFFSKYHEIRSFLWIWSHLLKKSLMGNFIFCAVYKDRNFAFVFLREYTDQRKPVLWCHLRTPSRFVLHKNQYYFLKLRYYVRILYCFIILRAVFSLTLKVKICIMSRMVRQCYDDSSMSV